VRLLTRKKEEINDTFFYNRILKAWHYRQKTGYVEKSRLVFGEADYLPSLIIDKFNDYFSIRPAIFYSGMGGTINATYGDESGNTVTNTYNTNDEYKLHYLEVPVDFIGHLPVGDGANIFLGGGPFYAYGLNGTNKQSFFTADPVVRQIKFGNDGDFKSSDYGITSTLGFQGAKGWSISANLDFGLNNIIQNNTTGFEATKLNTITFYLSIGQSF